MVIEDRDGRFYEFKTKDEHCWPPANLVCFPANRILLLLMFDLTAELISTPTDKTDFKPVGARESRKPLPDGEMRIGTNGWNESDYEKLKAPVLELSPLERTKQA